MFGKRGNALDKIKQIHSFVVTKGMDIFSYGIGVGIATVWALKQIKDKRIFKKPLITYRWHISSVSIYF